MSRFTPSHGRKPAHIGFDVLKVKADEALDASEPMSEWFELSYAQFLTVPRVVLESMPKVWQRRMRNLLNEMDDTFDWRPKSGRYWVRLRDDKGRFAAPPLCDYRHGDVEHLRK